MRARFLAPMVALLAASCGTADAYPLQAEAPNETASVPVRVGRPGWVTVVILELRPGDHIELASAEALGVGEGATTTFYVSPPIAQADGSYVIGEAREPLPGWTTTVPADATASAVADTTVGILAEITPNEPGRYALESVRLTYRLNGGEEQVREGIHTVLVVCADDPAPADCE